jgi:hypothetical protein
MESEFIAFDKIGEEAEWIQNFLENISCWPKLVPTIFVHCDSWLAIGRTQNSMYNEKSRHIRRRYNNVKHLLSNEIIFINYVNSKKNNVNPLTKGLTREFVYNSSRGMDLKLFKRWKSIMMVTILSWLEIPRSRFKWKIKSITISVTLKKYYFLIIPMMK